MYEKGGKPQEEKPSEENPEQKEQDRPPQNEQTSAEDQPEEHSEQKEQDRPPQNEQTQPRKKRKVQKPPPKNRKVRFAFWIFFWLFTIRIAVYTFQVSEKWVADLDLKIREREIISKGGMLSDLHMYAVHKLMAEAFPHLQGLQSTLHLETGSFTPVSEGSGYLPEGL